MSLHNSINRKPHRYNTLEAVQVINSEKKVIGIVISKLHKASKNGKPDEPYYIISGYGPAVWEGDLDRVTDEDYMLFMAQGGVK